MTDAQWAEFFDRLEGPEGCDFKEDADGKTTWNCAGGNDKTHARAILTAMSLDPIHISDVLHEVEYFGGYCDCEILFNAAPRIAETRPTLTDWA